MCRRQTECERNPAQPELSKLSLILSRLPLPRHTHTMYTRFRCFPPEAGVAASLVSQPSDTIFVEVSDKAGGSVSVVDTVKGVFKDGGAGAFYKGALPRAAKSALNIALQFFLYDSLKRLAGVAPDDLKVSRLSAVSSPFLFIYFFVVRGWGLGM